MKILESRRNSSSVRESSDQVGNLIKPLTRECTGIYLHNWESKYSTSRYNVKKVTVHFSGMLPPVIGLSGSAWAIFLPLSVLPATASIEGGCHCQYRRWLQLPV
jgi:hypothetical protein